MTIGTRYEFCCRESTHFLQEGDHGDHDLLYLPGPAKPVLNEGATLVGAPLLFMDLDEMEPGQHGSKCHDG